MKNSAVLHNFQTQLPWFLMTENWGKQPFWTPLGAGLHIQGLWISDGNLSSRFSSTWWFYITTKSQKQGFFLTRGMLKSTWLYHHVPHQVPFFWGFNPHPQGSLSVDIAGCFTGTPVNPGRGHCSVPRKIRMCKSCYRWFWKWSSSSPMARKSPNWSVDGSFLDWFQLCLIGGWSNQPQRCHLYVGKIVNYPLVN
jgi:hypothetical protein